MSEEQLFRVSIIGAVWSGICFVVGVGCGYLIGRLSERAAIAKATGSAPAQADKEVG